MSLFPKRSYAWRRRQVSFPRDLVAGLVVALVALPLCVGIAVASHAPISAGLIAGIVGGLIVPLVSRSPLGVSGPAAGLTAIAAQGIDQLGFEAFLTATFLAGLLQVALGWVRGDIIGYFFPSSVIYGMLAGIGGILLISQAPYFLGYAKGFVAVPPMGSGPHVGALLIGIGSLLLLLLWSHPRLKLLSKWIPSVLVALVGGVGIKWLWESLYPDRVLPPALCLSVEETHLQLRTLLRPLDLHNFGQYAVWGVALTLAVVASVETLLCVEALDRIDPLGRCTPKRQELFAQGIGNMMCGLFGGVPITQVIVRSSTAVQAGGRGRMTPFLHGVFLLLFVLVLSPYLAQIPLAAIATVLIAVAYKLLSPQSFMQQWRMGYTRFIPFLATFLGVMLLDLLKGVGIGLGLSAFFILWENYWMGSYAQVVWQGNTLWLRLGEQVTFLNKAHLARKLGSLPKGTHLIVDASHSRFVDPDIWELLATFSREAKQKGITVEIRHRKA